ncbi:hypothetical protein E8E13_011609 [Curvularia kusanoi]|uniref:BTB domain-containing protein n=1 Tax=Curvularia kusanoi TaxID=90978 RepID=A0A9P4TP58_CURKU|nr:hypothetical protein E8E13_011609 [Curvularia kusanoi]
MTASPQKQALALLKDLLNSGDYADLIITCGQDTYKVHKAVVCVRSGFFARAVRFGGQETHTGSIHLPEDDPEIIKLLMQYLYEAEYSPVLPTTDQQGATTTLPSSRSKHSKEYRLDFPHTCFENPGFPCPRNVCPHHWCGSECAYDCSAFVCRICVTQPLPPAAGKAEDLLLHAKMYEIGDKYEVAGLRDIAKDKFNVSCKHFWNTTSFGLAAKHVFSTTVEDDKGLRDIVSATISDHIELVNDPEVDKVMIEHNGLAVGVLQAKIKEGGWNKK